MNPLSSPKLLNNLYIFNKDVVQEYSYIVKRPKPIHQTYLSITYFKSRLETTSKSSIVMDMQFVIKINGDIKVDYLYWY